MKFMTTKELKAIYIPKFKHELAEGLPEIAIVSMITQMRHVGQINTKEANIMADCLWIAKGELREEAE